MDSIAAKLGMDPTEFRLKNMPKAGDKIVGVPKLRDVSLGETIRIAKEKIGWGKVKLEKNQGIGIATGLMDRERRSRRRRHCESKRRRLGDGAHRQDRHGHHPRFRYSNDCRRRAWHTGERCHRGQRRHRRAARGTQARSAAAASWFPAARSRLAAIDARNQIFKMAARKLEASPDDLEIVDKQIRVKGTPAKAVALATVATDAHNVIGEVIGRGYCDNLAADGRRKSPRQLAAVYDARLHRRSRVQTPAT